MSKLPDDLTRFLFLVPHVAQHPDGVPVADLCEQLSCTPAQLRRLVERVAMVGAPDGGPDELVEIYLEGDRVHVALPQRFTRPPRFTVDEMLALLLALAPLREAALPTLRERAGALTDRLLEVAGEHAGEVAPALVSRLVIQGDGDESPAHLRDLEIAVRERRVLDAEYYTAGRDVLGRRRLAPVGLLQVRGEWYAVGDDGKTFKVERFRELALTDETFEPPAIDLEAIRRRLVRGQLEGRLEEARLRVGGEERPWPTASTHALRRTVRAHRGAAELLAPAAERQALIDETRALLARYEESR